MKVTRKQLRDVVAETLQLEKLKKTIKAGGAGDSASKSMSSAADTYGTSGRSFGAKPDRGGAAHGNERRSFCSLPTPEEAQRMGAERFRRDYRPVRSVGFGRDMTDEEFESCQEEFEQILTTIQQPEEREERRQSTDNLKEGKCDKESGHEGCVRKREKGWVVLSNKTGKPWRGGGKKDGKIVYYDSEAEAKEALGGYHVAEGRKMTKNQLREMIITEAMLLEVEERESEMNEFVASRGGSKVMNAGRKIQSAGKSILDVANDQTGNMRRTLYTMSEFVEKVGAALSELGSLNEGESAADLLPTASELKRLQREIKRLER